MNRFLIVVLTLVWLCLALFAATGCGGEGVTPQAKGVISFGEPMAGVPFNRAQNAIIVVVGEETVNGQPLTVDTMQVFLWHFLEDGSTETVWSGIVPLNPNGVFAVDIPMSPFMATGDYVVIAIDTKRWMMGSSGRFPII